MNHCTHGVELNAYCPACALDVAQLEEWLGGPLTHDVLDFGALLHDCIGV